MKNNVCALTFRTHMANVLHSLFFSLPKYIYLSEDVKLSSRKYQAI